MADEKSSEGEEEVKDEPQNISIKNKFLGLKYNYED